MFVISTGGGAASRCRPAARRCAARTRDPDHEDDHAGERPARSCVALPQPQSLACGDRDQRQHEADGRGRRRRGGRPCPACGPATPGCSNVRRRPRPPPHDRRRARRSSGSSAWSTSSPPRTRPSPPPMPSVAEIRPIAARTRSRGNSSRMIPKHSGKMPPPTPCRTRPATTISSESPSAATTSRRAKKTERHHQEPALAEHVAEPPHQRREDGGGEEVAGERPGDAGGVGVEGGLELAERGDERRLGEGEGEGGGAQDEQAAHGLGAWVRSVRA